MAEEIKDLIKTCENDAFLERIHEHYTENGEETFLSEVSSDDDELCEMLEDDYYISTEIQATKDQPYKILVMDCEVNMLVSYIEIRQNCKLYRTDDYGGIEIVEIDSKFYLTEFPTPMETHSTELHKDIIEEWLKGEGHTNNLYLKYKDLVNEINF